MYVKGEGEILYMIIFNRMPDFPEKLLLSKVKGQSKSNILYGV